MLNGDGATNKFIREQYYECNLIYTYESICNDQKQREDSCMTKHPNFGNFTFLEHVPCVISQLKHAALTTMTMTSFELNAMPSLLMLSTYDDDLSVTAPHDTRLTSIKVALVTKESAVLVKLFSLI